MATQRQRLRRVTSLSGNRFRKTEYGERGYALPIVTTDTENSLEKRLAARPAHLEDLRLSNQRVGLSWLAPTRGGFKDPGPAGFTGNDRCRICIFE